MKMVLVWSALGYTAIPLNKIDKFIIKETLINTCIVNACIGVSSIKVYEAKTMEDCKLWIENLYDSENN